MISAGPELDALVAEHVMGYRNVVMWRGPMAVIDGAFPVRVSPYSTTIASAWEVVERMVAQADSERGVFMGPCFKPSWQYLTNQGYPLRLTCWYVRVELGECHRTICAETAPLAICLAALRVKGIEIPQASGERPQSSTGENEVVVSPTKEEERS